MLDVKTTHPDVAETLKEFEAYLQIEQPERLLDGKSPWTNIDLTLEQVKKNLSGSDLKSRTSFSPLLSYPKIFPNLELAQPFYQIKVIQIVTAFGLTI